MRYYQKKRFRKKKIFWNTPLIFEVYLFGMRCSSTAQTPNSSNSSNCNRIFSLGRSRGFQRGAVDVMQPYIDRAISNRSVRSRLSPVATCRVLYVHVISLEVGRVVVF